MLGPQLTVQERRHDGWVLLGLEGELDMATAPRLSEAIDDHSEEKVIVDLTNVTFIDSVGLRTLLQARQALGDDSLRLVAPDGPVLRLLQLTKLDQTFSVTESLP